MAQQCSLCDSWWPETCQCAQLATDAVLEYQNREASLGAAQQARDTLARGLSPNSRACGYHKTMLQNLVKTRKAKSKPSAPVAIYVFNDDILTKTAFLPMCTSCGVVCGALDYTAEGPIIVKEMDNCTCALAILGADCAFCEVQRFSAAKELAAEQCSAKTADGQKEVKCACGQVVGEHVLVKTCVGCGGMKTGPFDHEPVLEQATNSEKENKMPNVIEAAINEQPATPPNRHATPADQSAPKKRKRAAPRVQGVKKAKKTKLGGTAGFAAAGDAFSGTLFGEKTATMFDNPPYGYGYGPVATNGGDFWSQPGFPTSAPLPDFGSDSGDVPAAPVEESADDILRKALTEYMES